MSDLASKLTEIVTSSNLAGVSIRASYQPIGGAGEVVMPPTFGGDDPYLWEQMWIEGTRTEAVVIDQVPSQANRMEEALLEARDSGLVAFPLFEMTIDTPRGELRLTSLDLPHRYADAYLRDSEIAGQRFDKTPYGVKLRSATNDDVRPLYEREPFSLVLGAWDSHRQGRWPKFARLYQSRMYGIGPEADLRTGIEASSATRETGDAQQRRLLGARAGTRMDPLNLVGSIDDKEKAEEDWEFIASGEKKKGMKLSEIGHGNIAPVRGPGGVSLKSIQRTATISQAALRRVRFGDARPEAADAARATLLALALVGDRLAFGRPSLWLRSGCDLVRTEENVSIEHGGTESTPIELSVDTAIEAFAELRNHATKLGIPMADDTVRIKPIASLRKAIEHAVTADEPEGD